MNRHHHKHEDEADVFRRQSLNAIKFRKIAAKVAYCILCVAVVVVLVFALWLYL